MIFPTPYIAAGALAVGLLTGWTANGWRLNSKIDQMVLEHTQAVQAATQKALDETTRMQREKDNAIAQAQAQAKSNAAAASSARAERDGLRNQINTATSALPTATCASSRDYAATAAALFDQCAAALEELATKADGHATDSRTLTNSWPTTERKP